MDASRELKKIKPGSERSFRKNLPGRGGMVRSAIPFPTVGKFKKWAV